MNQLNNQSIVDQKRGGGGKRLVFILFFFSLIKRENKFTVVPVSIHYTHEKILSSSMNCSLNIIQI